MSAAYGSPLGLVAYVALFAAVGLVFLAVNLLLGRFIRPNTPTTEKQEIYECGEPAIGSSFVQFDLRFYVIALLFIIFDVEIAFFFPWGTVFGKSNHLADPRFETVVQADDGSLALTPQAKMLYQEMGIDNPSVPTEVPQSLRGRVADDAGSKEMASEVIRAGGKQLAWVTITDILIFFAVLLVGFAYVWKRGDLDWVRALTRERASPGPTLALDTLPENEQILSV